MTEQERINELELQLQEARDTLEREGRSARSELDIAHKNLEDIAPVIGERDNALAQLEEKNLALQQSIVNWHTERDHAREARRQLDETKQELSVARRELENSKLAAQSEGIARQKAETELANYKKQNRRDQQTSFTHTNPRPSGNRPPVDDVGHLHAKIKDLKENLPSAVRWATNSAYWTTELHRLLPGESEGLLLQLNDDAEARLKLIEANQVLLERIRVELEKYDGMNGCDLAERIKDAISELTLDSDTLRHKLSEAQLEILRLEEVEVESMERDGRRRDKLNAQTREIGELNQEQHNLRKQVETLKGELVVNRSAQRDLWGDAQDLQRRLSKLDEDVRSALDFWSDRERAKQILNEAIHPNNQQESKFGLGSREPTFGAPGTETEDVGVAPNPRHQPLNLSSDRSKQIDRAVKANDADIAAGATARFAVFDPENYEEDREVLLKTYEREIIAAHDYLTSMGLPEYENLTLKERVERLVLVMDPSKNLDSAESLLREAHKLNMSEELSGKIDIFLRRNSMCYSCKRPVANEEDAKSMSLGEGNHLCWNKTGFCQGDNSRPLNHSPEALKVFEDRLNEEDATICVWVAEYKTILGWCPFPVQDAVWLVENEAEMGMELIKKNYPSFELRVKPYYPRE